MNETQRFAFSALLSTQTLRHLLRWLIPNGGTLLLLAVFLFAQSVGAIPLPTRQSAPHWPTTPTINYQGRLANNAGDPISDTLAMQFSFYDSDTGGTMLWGPETHPTVEVAEGLFSVALGQLSGGIPTSALSGDVWLEIAVDGETLSPREQLRAVPYAMQASVALTVPDGSITTAKLNIDEEIDFQGYSLLNVDDIDSADEQNLHITNSYGRIRMRSINDLWIFLDTDNNQDDAVFRIYHDNSYLGPPLQSLLTLNESGDLSVLGGISHGALIENNIQTPEELAAERIDRFSQGDVLCWAGDRLERCSRLSDPLVQAIADENGKPIVIGAEVVKVVGPVRVGDLLVASEIPGYAVVDNDPAPGAVIAQALEDFDGARGMVRAMIRKF
jgi:hypothetical protein